MKACIFCSIARGDTDAHMVADEGAVLAFLDRAPLLPGHTLVIPREHADTLDELPGAEVGPLFRLVQRVSRAQQRAFGADGTFTGINTRVSQSVPHLHAHVVPRREGDGLFRAGMVWARKRYKDGEAESIAAKLRDALAKES